MCSIRCDRPASASVSPTDPAPIQSPSATDRTESMCSVTTRTPESNSVRRWSRSNAVALVAIAASAVARPAGAARATVAATLAVAPRAAAVATGTTAVAASSADAGEILDRLAGDLGVVGEAQPDAAALAVDLDDADADLVAL